jgi:hypothetical protein
LPGTAGAAEMSDAPHQAPSAERPEEAHERALKPWWQQTWGVTVLVFAFTALALAAFLVRLLLASPEGTTPASNAAGADGESLIVQELEPELEKIQDVPEESETRSDAENSPLCGEADLIGVMTRDIGYGFRSDGPERRLYIEQVESALLDLYPVADSAGEVALTALVVDAVAALDDEPFDPIGWLGRALDVAEAGLEACIGTADERDTEQRERRQKFLDDADVEPAEVPGAPEVDLDGLSADDVAEAFEVTWNEMTETEQEGACWVMSFDEALIVDAFLVGLEDVVEHQFMADLVNEACTGVDG